MLLRGLWSRMSKLLTLFRAPERHECLYAKRFPFFLASPLEIFNPNFTSFSTLWTSTNLLLSSTASPPTISRWCLRLRRKPRRSHAPKARRWHLSTRRHWPSKSRRHRHARLLEPLRRRHKTRGMEVLRSAVAGLARRRSLR